MIATLDGVRLADWRRKLLMTQAQLAVRAGVAPATVSNIERGEHAPRMGVIQRLSAILGVDPLEVDEFKAALFRDDAPHQDP